MARRILLFAVAAALQATLAGAAEVGPPAPAPAAAPAPGSQKEAKAKAWFTDTVLIDQQGRPVRFYSDVVAGKVVCFTFVFTQCRDACPLLMARLNRVKASLGPRFGGEVTFVAISVDPENDTPAALQAFATRHGAADAGWTFLTGSRADLAMVAGRLGGWPESPDQHTTAFVAGNARTRHWIKVRPDTPPEAVAEQLRGLADEG
jgi:cytochrome oxidase Cu insertion factor (SCO1/SenC/PrrC family)